MQSDGNLVVYDSAWHPYWDSRTSGNPVFGLFVQNDGNVVIYRTNWAPIWATNLVADDKTCIQYILTICKTELAVKNIGNNLISDKSALNCAVKEQQNKTRVKKKT